MSSQDDSRRGAQSGWAERADGTRGGRVTAVRSVCATWLTTAITPITNILEGRSRRCTVFVSILLVTSLVVAPVTVVSAGGLDPLFTIPNPEPGVDRTYDDTYRVLANNDEDVDPSEIDYDGYYQTDYPFFPVELGDSSQSPSQTLRYAGASDVYLTDISDFSAIPYQDEWNRYSDAPSYKETQFILVHGNNTYDGPKSTDGKWFVRVTNQYGEWRPVYNAEVKWDPDEEELYIANPDEALIHDAEHGSVISRHLHVTDQYMRYSQDSDRVAVPMMNGREVFPTSNGASMPRKWGQSNFNTVRDAWVGINHVFGSVWYRDSYVSGGSPTRGAYVPFDYRAIAPSDYSQSDTCSRTHTHGNDTHTHDYPKTEWAKYTLLDSRAEVTSVRLDRPGFSGDSEWNRFGNATWIAIHNTTSANFVYPRGEYILTATLEITTEVETEWGVTSSRCSEWSRTSTGTYTHTTTYSVPVTITDWDSPNLEVDVAHIDGPGFDRLIVKWRGDQDLPGDPWKRVKVNIGNKTVWIDSPWRFYGISRNDEVEVRADGGSTTYDTTHTHADRWPAIFHYQTSVANVTYAFPQKNEEEQRWGYIETVDSQIAATPPGAPLPANVNDPDNHAPTELYTQHVINVKSSDLDTGETVSAEVTNPYGAALDDDQVEVYSQSFEPTVLRMIEVDKSDTGEGHEGVLILTDTSDNFLEGETIHVNQDDGTSWTVTTDSEGRAKVAWDGSLLRARYDGDVWFESDEPYYKRDSILYILPPSPLEFEAVGEVGEYIAASINNTLIFVEWIALGIFAVWWVRMRRRSSKGKSS